MYLKTRKALAQARAAKERYRLARAEHRDPVIIPDLRRKIVVIDYDHGKIVHTFKLYQADRIDCYRVEVDGSPWKRRAGWSTVCEGLRKAMPRLLSPHAD